MSRPLTQVKRLSLVTHPEADRVENLEGNSRRPQRQWSLETPAGSKSTAIWAEMEAINSAGRSPPSRLEIVGRVWSTERNQTRETEATVEVDSLVVLGARAKPRTREAVGARLQ